VWEGKSRSNPKDSRSALPLLTRLLPSDITNNQGRLSPDHLQFRFGPCIVTLRRLGGIDQAL